MLYGGDKEWSLRHAGSPNYRLASTKKTFTVRLKEAIRINEFLNLPPTASAHGGVPHSSPLKETAVRCWREEWGGVKGVDIDFLL